MWTAIYMTEDEKKSLKITNFLKEEGFLVKCEKCDKNTYVLYAPEFEVEEVQNYLYQSEILNDY